MFIISPIKLVKILCYMVCAFNLNALTENGGQLGKLFVCLFRPFTTEQVNDIIMMSSCICISLI